MTSFKKSSTSPNGNATNTIKKLTSTLKQNKLSFVSGKNNNKIERAPKKALKNILFSLVSFLRIFQTLKSKIKSKTKLVNRTKSTYIFIIMNNHNFSFWNSIKKRQVETCLTKKKKAYFASSFVILISSLPL